MLSTSLDRCVIAVRILLHALLDTPLYPTPGVQPGDVERAGETKVLYDIETDVHYIIHLLPR